MHTVTTSRARIHSVRNYALGALIVFVGIPTAIAQTASDPSHAAIGQLHQRMDAMQQELDHLRQQNSRMSAAQMQFASFGETEPWSECDSCCNNTVGCDVSQSCGCHPCQCGQCPAPCIECPRVSTLNPYFNVHIFGALKLDMLLSDARAIAPGTPYYLLPGSPAGLSQNTSDFHARQSSLGAMLTGPQIGAFQAGGNVLVYFYNDNAFADAYGILPLQVWGDLKNENWRFAAGYQFDVFNPMAPTILPFSALCGSGNAGNAARGQVRVERFVRPSDDVQWTAQFALSEPITSIIDPAFRISEDNGWPNVEGRIALGLGSVAGAGMAAQRPFEIGFSGVVGQVRNTVPNASNLTIERYVADVWGVGSDVRWRINDYFGVKGEFYTGQGLGTYNGGALQITNPDNNFQGIKSTGGWGEFFVFWTPCLHSHFGYGIDDPRDADVPTTAALLGRVANETIFGNIIWDVTESFRVAFEVTHRETSFRSPLVPDNDGMFYHTQVTWSF